MRRVLPILFNTEMVTAILDGRKTETRRVVKPQPEKDMKYKKGYCIMGGAKKDHGKFGFGTREWGGRIAFARPPASVGDILYVREKWCRNDTGEYYYAANRKSGADAPYGLKWHPSIHMPKEAARIWLEVTNVRVEHLQEMTLDDFLQEGIEVPYEAFNDPDNAYMQAKSLFAEIWDSTTISRPKIGIYGWKANPWVWVIEFERCYKEDRHL